MRFKSEHYETDSLEEVKQTIKNCVTGAFFNLAEEFIELNKNEYSSIRQILHELASDCADKNQGMMMSFYLELVKKYDKELKNI